MGRTKKSIEGKCPFVIRRRQLKDGRASLFIDRFEEGKHKYHFLKLYLLPGKSEKTRRDNIRTLRRAEDIQREMRIELLSEAQSSKREGVSGSVSLGAFIASLVEEYKKEGKAGYRHLITAKSNLEKFRPNIIMSEIDREFLISYYNWLRNDCTTSKGRRLKEMTVHIYFRKLGVILTWAYSRGVL